MKRAIFSVVAGLMTIGFASDVAKADDLSWFNKYMTPGLPAGTYRMYLQKAQNSWNLMKGERDAAIAAKNAAVAAKNLAITERNNAITQRNVAISEREALKVERNALRNDLAVTLVDRDRAFADRDALKSALDSVAADRDVARTDLATSEGARQDLQSQLDAALRRVAELEQKAASTPSDPSVDP